jgi:hypothetical protein
MRLRVSWRLGLDVVPMTEVVLKDDERKILDKSTVQRRITHNEMLYLYQTRRNKPQWLKITLTSDTWKTRRG